VTAADEYLLGASDDELARLGFQHQVWLDETAALWNAAGFGPGDTLADLGSGPGFASFDLAQRVGSAGRVIAVEASPRFIAHMEAARLDNVTPVPSDVHAIELADASVDGAFARWLLCFVAEPEKVIAEVARILRPGGTFVAMDYYNYLAAKLVPSEPAFETLFRAYHASVIPEGGSYDIGERLPALLMAAGLTVERLVPIHRVARPGSLHWQWFAGFNRVFMPRLVELRLWTDEQRAAFEAAWKVISDNPAAFFVTPPILGIVAKKPA
jgi:ubiquinone/menaquinone biosynthesis C-methylase UbiE